MEAFIEVKNTARLAQNLQNDRAVKETTQF